MIRRKRKYSVICLLGQTQRNPQSDSRKAKTKPTPLKPNEKKKTQRKTAIDKGKKLKNDHE